MLYFERINLSGGIDPAKSNENKECMIYRYCFINHEVRFQNHVCSGFHNFAMLCLNISDIAIITVKGVDYRCIIHDLTKSEAICLLENYMLDDCGYM